VTTTPLAARTERPGSIADAAALLRSTTGPVLIRGAGTALGWGGRVDPVDLVVETAGMSGVLTHNAADMTASVGAGTPLRELNEQLAADGQFLALDPPVEAQGATIGGLLSTADAGPLRLRYGSPRDLVIGVTLVLADGTVAHAGGHVIKNVAGYDLAKLVHGSLGTLALVAEVVVRLHPRPATTAVVTAPADAEAATRVALALMASPLEPSAVEWAADGEVGRLLVRFDGPQAGVDAQSEGATALLSREGLTGERLPGSTGDLWRDHAAAVRGHEGELVARLSTLPSRLPDVAAAARRCAEQAGARSSMVSSAALGLHTVRVTGTPEAQAMAFTTLQAEARMLGGSLLLRSRPADVDDLVDPLGPPPSTGPLLARVKAEFDPGNRLAPGRLRPWY
jgi:glycolate oxidase FAD binding subunit